MPFVTDNVFQVFFPLCKFIPGSFPVWNSEWVSFKPYLLTCFLIKADSRRLIESFQILKEPLSLLRDQTSLIKYCPRLLELLNSKYQRRHLCWNKECSRENHHKAEVWDSMCLHSPKQFSSWHLQKSCCFPCTFLNYRTTSEASGSLWLAEKCSTAAFSVNLRVQNLIPSISYFLGKSPEG